MPATETSEATKNEKIRDAMSRVAFLQAHGLLTIVVSKDQSEDEIKLAQKIGLLDKRAHRELGVGTEEWEAVIQLLVNAISLGLNSGQMKMGWENYAEAEKLFAYYQQLAPRNRITYLLGMAIGIVAVGVLGCGAQFLSPIVAPGAPQNLLPIVCLFAALGSVASVLSRLSKIEELGRRNAKFTLLLSGASRPTIAAIFGIIVYLILDLGIVTIHVGDSQNPERLYLVAGFLCGFSERFATEILARVVPTDEKAAE